LIINGNKIQSEEKKNNDSKIFNLNKTLTNKKENLSNSIIINKKEVNINILNDNKNEEIPRQITNIQAEKKTIENDKLDKSKIKYF